MLACLVNHLVYKPVFFRFNISPKNVHEFKLLYQVWDYFSWTSVFRIKSEGISYIFLNINRGGKKCSVQNYFSDVITLKFQRYLAKRNNLFQLLNLTLFLHIIISGLIIEIFFNLSLISHASVLNHNTIICTYYNGHSIS